MGSTAYDHRSPLMTAGPTLAAWSVAWSLTSADAASPPNTATQSFSATVDNTAPGATPVTTTNVAGGTISRLDAGDTMTLTATEPLDPQSILPGWTGNATPVIVALSDGTANGSDILHVADPASVTLPLGAFDLGRNDYATGPVTFGQTSPPSTMTRVGNAIVVTLGAVSGPNLAAKGPGHISWTPSNLATHRAGNPMPTTPAIHSGVHLRGF